MPEHHPSRPILVTGVPRSGTTWLARWIALAPGMALTGREPMNPRGRQYALAGTLPGWARVTAPTPRQRRALVLAYRGLNPWVYSRYGLHQWTAPLPRTRLVVKDPFAILSIPAVASLTGALPVLVYRHPGAVLASYQRMGWTPDLEELQGVLDEARHEGGPALPALPAEGEVSPAEAMGRFWSALHELALADTAASGTELVVVAHHDIAASGPAGGRRLIERLGLQWNAALERELERESGASEPKSTNLHNFNRAPADVADAWRAKVSPVDTAAIEDVAGSTLARLHAARLQLS